MRTPRNEDSAFVDQCLKKMIEIYGLENSKELAKQLRTTTANFSLWRFRVTSLKENYKNLNLIPVKIEAFCINKGASFFFITRLRGGETSKPVEIILYRKTA